MNQILHNWDMQPLSELVDAIRQQGRIEKDKLYELWSIPSFSDGRPELIEGKKIGSSKLKVEPNDILISKINPRINRVWIVEDSHLEQLASPEWLIARVKDSNKLDKKFLRYYLSSPEFREWISQAASSVTGSHSRAKSSEILQRNIPLPPLPEQQKIVEILEDHLSRLDAALADVKQAKLKAAQFRRSLLQTAFTGNLTGDGTRIMTEWKVESIGDVCSFITDGSHNPPKGISQSEYFMLSSKDIQDGHLVFNNPRFLSEKDFEIENNRTKLQLDDVLLTTVGTIGRTAIYRGVPAKVTFQRSVSILRPVREKITPQYLKYFFDSITHVLTRESRGVAQQGIYLNQLKKIQVSYPPLPEQQKIVEILEDHLSRLDASVAIADAMEKQSASLRRSLLQAAFTGQLTKEVASV